jgi:hypothetical protein
MTGAMPIAPVFGVTSVYDGRWVAVVCESRRDGWTGFALEKLRIIDGPF